MADLSVKKYEGMSPAQLETEMVGRDIAFAKKGIFIALLGAALWGLYGVFMGQAYTFEPFTNPIYPALVVAAAAGFMQETIASVCMLVRNISTGKAKEYKRTFATKPGVIIMLGSVVGGPVAVTCSMFAMINCGAAYTLAIGAMSPVIASLLGVLFLKEKTNLRFWLGLVCVVAGGIITSYVAPDGEQYPNFYFGIILAFASAVGWGLEGLTGTLGTDAVDSEVGVGIRYLCSACVYFLFILVIGGFDFLYDCIFVHPQGFVYVLIACIIGAIGVMYWYVSFNMTGCTRAMTINSTYGLWNIFYSLILSAFGIFEVAINSNLVIGSIMIVAGIFLVLANPRDLLELRKS